MVSVRISKPTKHIIQNFRNIQLCRIKFVRNTADLHSRNSFILALGLTVIDDILSSSKSFFNLKCNITYRLRHAIVFKKETLACKWMCCAQKIEINHIFTSVCKLCVSTLIRYNYLSIIIIYSTKKKRFLCIKLDSRYSNQHAMIKN